VSTDGKTLITCAVTGNLVKPEQTPHLPITPAQIADECLAAAEAGAGQVHIHRQTSIQAAANFADGYVDWIYIDTDHSYETTAQELRHSSAAALETAGVAAAIAP